MMDPPLTRPREFADELKITEPSLRKLFLEGLPFIQIKKRRAIWIDRKAAYAWLAQYMQQRRAPDKESEPFK